jgi:hypothetical protein
MSEQGRPGGLHSPIPESGIILSSSRYSNHSLRGWAQSRGMPPGPVAVPFGSGDLTPEDPYGSGWGSGVPDSGAGGASEY